MGLGAGWQKQGYASYIVARTYTEKVGLIDWRIGKGKKIKKEREERRKKKRKRKKKRNEKEKEKNERGRKDSFLGADRVGCFQSHAVSTVIAGFKASNDFCFTIES